MGVVGLNAGVAAISAGGGHTCALLDTGAVQCWGADTSGQLGDGGVDLDQNSPVAVVGLDSGASAIAAGSTHSCALLAGGGVKCWGGDAAGQLGDGGARLAQPTPVDVVGLSTAAVAIAAGGDHTCAVLDTGALACWGGDALGQLGDDDLLIDQDTPVAVAGLATGVAEVTAGREHTCARLEIGAMKCWGSDSWGQLGDDTRWGDGHAAVPVAVPSIP